MDQRNADGSIAEVSGNGVRVFARYLVAVGLAAPGRIDVGTRAGLRSAVPEPDRSVTVQMGPATVAVGNPRLRRRGERRVRRGRAAVAAGAAWLHRRGRESGRVDVLTPGGRLVVTVRPGGSTLRGPAVPVARGQLDPGWWAGPAGDGGGDGSAPGVSRIDRSGEQITNTPATA
jgi:diaminopimelate epimerase